MPARPSNAADAGPARRTHLVRPCAAARHAADPAAHATSLDMRIETSLALAVAAAARDPHDDVEGRGPRSRTAACGRSSPAMSARSSIRPGRRPGTGVHRGERAVSAGRHRLEHVQRLASPHLADDQPIRPHPKRIAHAALRMPDLAAPFDLLPAPRAARRADGRCALGGVLDGDDAFRSVDVRGEGAEQRGLPLEVSPLTMIARRFRTHARAALHCVEAMRARRARQACRGGSENRRASATARRAPAAAGRR